jgi:hypothetical protein
MAVVEVAATAICTRRPASAVARRSASPIARSEPVEGLCPELVEGAGNSNVSPLMSSVTVRSPCVSTRGEKSRAIWTSAA